MTKSSVRIPNTLLVVMVFLCGLTALADAQTAPPRRDTGRHRPRPALEPQPTREPKLDRADSGRASWFIGLGAGVQGSGDLWRLQTVNGAAVPWVATVPFSSSRFDMAISQGYTEFQVVYLALCRLAAQLRQR